jgi:putative spermidine/putrescine transport system substrate-binding protein
MSFASCRHAAQYAAGCLVAMFVFGIPYMKTRAAETVIHSTGYTGVWFDAQKTCVFEPFNVKYKSEGLSVVADPGLSSTTLVRLRSEQSKPTLDVAWLDGGISEQALKDGVLDAIDPQAVTNINNMVSQGIYKTGSGDIYALSTGYYAQGMFYNPDVKDKPDSWWDLWKPEYAGRSIFPSPAQAPFVPTIVFLNKLLGGSISNLDPVMKKFATLKVSQYYDATGVVQAALASGDILIGSYYVNTAWTLADTGLPVHPLAPKEGVPAGDIRVELVKGAPHKLDAEKFINFAVSPEALNCLAEKLYLGPPLKHPQLTEHARDRMPWGATGSVEDLAIPDWNEINAHRAEIIDQWNRRVINK